MAELKQNKQRNGKLSLYPLKFEEAVRAIVKIKSPNKADRNNPVKARINGSF